MKSKKPRIIAIIGGTGKMGQMFAREFKKQKYNVIISGRSTKITPKDAALKADVVIVTVPIRNTEETIREILPYVRGTALLTDFTSVKVKPCQWMKGANCEVIGGHPVFGPLKNINGQNFVLCPVRGSSYVEWYKGVLKKMGLNVLLMATEEHDKAMAVVQCLNHISNIAFGTALKALNFNLDNKLVSPNFELRLYPVGRMLAQDEKMYGDIETENHYSKEAAKAYLDIVSAVKVMIDNNDKSSIENLIVEARNYFGGLSGEAMELTSKILEGMNKYKNKKGKK